MPDEYITLHTTVHVNNDPPPIPDVTADGDVIWRDRDGNAISEESGHTYLYVRVTVPLRVRARDVIAVLPEFDDTSQYWGDTPHHSQLILRDQMSRLSVRESVNEVLALLGWGEMDVTGPHAQYVGR